MTSITPEQARRLLKADSGRTHGPNTHCQFCESVKQNAWQMTQQIAGLTWEYGVIHNGVMLLAIKREVKYGTILQLWGTHDEALNAAEKLSNCDVGLVRRLVSQPEEVQP